MARYIELISNRSKGINAYLCLEGASHINNNYGVPVDEINKERAHRSKSHKVEIRIDNLPDGIYRIVECGGADLNKVSKRYLKIVDGDIDEESENLNSLIVGNDLNLPELEGTPKQIKWAEDIRKRAIAKYKSHNMKFPKMLIQVKTAKWFIDNQDSF